MLPQEAVDESCVCAGLFQYRGTIYQFWGSLQSSVTSKPEYGGLLGPPSTASALGSARMRHTERVSRHALDAARTPYFVKTSHDFGAAEEFIPIYLTGFESCASDPP